MHADTAQLPTETTERTAAAPSAPPRLWLPLTAVAVYWAAAMVVGRLEKPYFYGFLYGMGSAALLTLVYFGWWWSRRTVRLRDRLIGFLIVVTGGVVTATFVHPSLGGFGLAFTALPFALTAWTLWMVAAKRWGLALVGPGALVVGW